MKLKKVDKEFITLDIKSVIPVIIVDDHPWDWTYTSTVEHLLRDCNGRTITVAKG